MASETLELGGTAAAPAAPAPRSPARGPGWVAPVVAGLLVLALAVRATIGLHSGVWRDEAQLLFIVDQPSWSAMLDFLRQHESHPPLMYALLRVWQSVAGTGDAAALVIPIALGAALVPAVYAVGARLLSWRVGLFAAAATALSPILVAGGAMARPYSLLPLLAVGAAYALVRAIDVGGVRRWAGYAAASLGLVYAHNWAWVILGALWVAFGVCVLRGLPRPRSAVLRGWAGAQAAVAIGFLPWLPSFLHQSAHAGYAPSPLLAEGPGRLPVVLVGLVTLLLTSTLTLPDGAALPTAAVLWTLVVSLLAIVAGRSVRAPGRPRPRPEQARPASPARTAQTVLLVTPLAAIGLALLLSPRSDLLVPHCVAVLTPLLLLVVAAALERWRRAGLAWLAGTAAISMIVGYAAMVPPLYQQHRSNAREVAEQVAATAAPTDLVLVSPWWLTSSFNRYYPLPTEQIDFPAFGRAGAVPYDDAASRGADPQALAEAERRLIAAHAAGRRTWFVTEGNTVTCPDADCEAQVLGSGNFGLVGSLRTAELRAFVTKLYGPPVSCSTGTAGRGRLESLTACLYGPPARG